MRISDWSSDVCSSDLASTGRRKALQTPRAQSKPTIARTNQRWRIDNPTIRSSTVRPPRGRGSRRISRYRRAREIGRASGRERVGQYVYISVVAVLLKTKRILLIDFDNIITKYK